MHARSSCRRARSYSRARAMKQPTRNRIDGMNRGNGALVLNRLYALGAAVVAVVAIGTFPAPAAAQSRADAGKGRAEAPAAPTPRLPDGTVDLGGDGIWDQPWITDFGKQLVGGADAKI